MSDQAPSAAVALAELAALRAEEEERLHRVEAEQRKAGAAREEARLGLIRGEREGVSPAKWAKLEAALAEAEAAVNQRWSERLEGRREAIRDCDVALRRYASEHIVELIETIESDGRAVVARINKLAAELIAACEERSAIEAKLFSTLSLTGRTNSPGDVNRGRSGAIGIALAAFLREGGEVAPQVRVPELLGERAAA